MPHAPILLYRPRVLTRHLLRCITVSSLLRGEAAHHGIPWPRGTMGDVVQPQSPAHKGEWWHKATELPLPWGNMAALSKFWGIWFKKTIKISQHFSWKMSFSQTTSFPSRTVLMEIFWPALLDTLTLQSYNWSQYMHTMKFSVLQKDFYASPQEVLLPSASLLTLPISSSCSGG